MRGADVGSFGQNKEGQLTRDAETVGKYGSIGMGRPFIFLYSTVCVVEFMIASGGFDSAVLCQGISINFWVLPTDVVA